MRQRAEQSVHSRLVGRGRILPQSSSRRIPYSNLEQPAASLACMHTAPSKHEDEELDEFFPTVELRVRTGNKMMRVDVNTLDFQLLCETHTPIMQ